MTRTCPILVALALAGTVRAATAGSTDVAASSLTDPSVAGREARAILLRGAETSRTVPLTFPALTLTAHHPAPIDVNLLLRPRTVRPTRFQTLLYGAGRGISQAGTVGTWGAVLGLWDEDTAWAMIAAGAAAGALWGATAGTQNASFGARVAWDPTGP